MYNALFKIAVALAALWLEVHEVGIETSTYYIFSDHVGNDDPLVVDPRVANGKHLEVTIKVVQDDDDYKEAFERHLKRQGVSADMAEADV